MKYATCFCALIAFCTVSARADDAEFAKKAAAGGMAEVALSKLAAQQGENPEVKKLGDHMVKDHTKANQELMEIAGKKNMALPKDLDPKHQAAHDKLKTMKGAEFDRAYIKQMVADHQETIDLFTKQAEGGKDADLKAFAAKQLPGLKDHLKMTNDVASKVGAAK